MMFTAKREKGDKILSLFLLSVARRCCEFGVLGEQCPNLAPRPMEKFLDAEKQAAQALERMDEDLKCEYTKERPIHDDETWMGLMEVYISLVGEDQATVELDPSRNFETALRIPFEVRQSPQRGRGIFAMTDVSKGEILYDFSNSAQFKKNSEYLEFLRTVRPDLACDVLQWSYIQYFGEGSYRIGTRTDDLRIVTDLDPGSFCNTGGRTDGNMAWLNADGEIAEGDIGHGKTDIPPLVKITRKDGSVRKDISGKDALKSAPLVAVRDIKKGEELLCIYEQLGPEEVQ